MSVGAVDLCQTIEDDRLMPDRALYFPFIEVPDSPALTRVLLYWDELGTIVPAHLDEGDIGPRTRRLADAGLTRSVQ
jgi:hypothetical protein